MDNKAIAVQTLCNIGDIVIFNIEDDKVCSAFFTYDKYERKAWSGIREDENGFYFMRFNQKYYLNDFIRMEV